MKKQNIFYMFCVFLSLIIVVVICDYVLCYGSEHTKIPAQRSHDDLEKEDVPVRINSVTEFLELPSSEIISCDLVHSTLYRRKLWEVQREDDVVIGIDSSTGELVYLLTLKITQKDRDVMMKKELLTEQEAMEIGRRVFQEFIPSADLSEIDSRIVDIAPLSFWIFTLPTRYKGFRIAGAEIELRLFAQTGKILSYSNLFMPKDKRIITEMGINETQAIETARNHAKKTSKDEIEDCKGVEAVIIDPSHKAWEITGISFAKTQPSLYWVVSFERTRNTRKISSINVFIDAESGNVIGEL